MVFEIKNPQGLSAWPVESSTSVGKSRILVGNSNNFDKMGEIVDFRSKISKTSDDASCR